MPPLKLTALTDHDQGFFLSLEKKDGIYTLIEEYRKDGGVPRDGRKGITL